MKEFKTSNTRFVDSGSIQREAEKEGSASHECTEYSVQRKTVQRAYDRSSGINNGKAYQSHSNGSTQMPVGVRGKMERAFGQDFSGVKIHSGSSSAVGLEAKAYTRGEEVHFAPGEYAPESKKGQELLGHELAHVVQQRSGKVQPTTQLKGVGVNTDQGLESEADRQGKAAAQGRQVRNTANTSNASADVIQGYFVKSYSKNTTTPGTWRQADDLSMVARESAPQHELYAEKGKAEESNKKLEAVGSGIELVETSEQATFIEGRVKKPKRQATLTKVEPRNKLNNTEGDTMKLWADCGKSNSVVVGGSDRCALYPDTEGGTKQVSGGHATELKSNMFLEILKDRMENAEDEGEKKKIQEVIDEANSKDQGIQEAYEKYTSETDDEMRKVLYSEWEQKMDEKAEILRKYYSKIPWEEREAIDKQFKINRYANPGVGQGYTMSSGGASHNLFREPGQPQIYSWNFHWGGVVMESNDKKDKVVLENYATGDPAEKNTKWDLMMYGTQQESETFHKQHKDSKAHRMSPTTLTIENEDN